MLHTAIDKQIEYKPQEFKIPGKPTNQANSYMAPDCGTTRNQMNISTKVGKIQSLLQVIVNNGGGFVQVTCGNYG